MDKHRGEISVRLKALSASVKQGFVQVNQGVIGKATDASSNEFLKGTVADHRRLLEGQTAMATGVGGGRRVKVLLVFLSIQKVI